MDVPLPGIGHWDKQLKNPKAWHFNFRGPDVERLVAGRERILLDRFYNELSANPSRIDEQTRVHTPSTTPSADSTPPSRKTLSTISSSSPRAN
jgi:hypothetical protein